jgi:hypothetical protein
LAGVSSISPVKRLRALVRGVISFDLIGEFRSCTFRNEFSCSNSFSFIGDVAWKKGEVLGPAWLVDSVSMFFMADFRNGEAAKGFMGFGSCIGPVYGLFLGDVRSFEAGDRGAASVLELSAALEAVRLRDLPCPCKPKEVDGPG